MSLINKSIAWVKKKLNAVFWDKVLKLTCGDSYIIALDSTGLCRTNPSYHYLKRIEGKTPKIPIKLSVALDTKKKKFSAARIRVLPAHDDKDVRKLLELSNPKIGVADKAYSIEKLYCYAESNGIILMIPKKKNVKKGYARNKMHKLFRKRTYNRRQLVEAGFSSYKRKYGFSVSSKQYLLMIFYNFKVTPKK